MDGKYFESDSNFLPKKRSRISDGEVGSRSNSSNEIGVDMISQLPDEIGVDRISQLPDDVVLVILSFLSLRESVTTSVLSSRWPYLWRDTPNLNLNTNLLKINHYEMPIEGMEWEVERCKYIEIVNSVLQSHKAPSLKEFRISLYVNKSAQCAVNKWFEFLFSRQVEGLELDFLCKEQIYMVVLEDLLRDSKMCMPQNLIAFEFLNRLCLKCFKVSSEAIDLLLRNCLSLEQLLIHDSILASDFVVCGTTLMLKHLDIYSCTSQYRVDGKTSIKVSAPNLTWLRVDSKSQILLLENIPKLISAEYIYTSESPDYVKHFASAVFCCISRLEVLKLTLLYPKVFFASDFRLMPKLKKLVVDYYGTCGHGLLPVTALIWASPHLREFELKCFNKRRDRTKWKEGMTIAERCPHQHLKEFRFMRFCPYAGDHMELLTYILDNCVALEKIILDCSLMFAYRYNSEVEGQADGKRIKQYLRDKVPDHIQLYTTSLPYISSHCFSARVLIKY